MNSSVLLVEDDDFKAGDIKKILAEFDLVETVRNVNSVTSALRLLLNEKFTLIILDMSLPTFDLSGPGGGGSPQGQGGLEVLRLTKRLAHSSNFIVVTQYPDIEIDGEEYPVGIAAAKLTQRFGLPVLKCILYEFDSDMWKILLRESINNFWV